jgi:hypothetical protein
MIVTEMLLQGVYFDSRTIRTLPATKNMIHRALRALIAAGVVTKSRARKKYLLTDEFLDWARREITRQMPRGTFIHHPDLSVFEVCGIGDWTPEELKTFMDKLEQRWILRKGAPQ